MDTITFEQLQSFINKKFNGMSQGFFFGKWSDEFVAKKLREAYTNFNEQLGTVIVPWETFTIDQMQQLGFKWWDEDKKMLLIPLYLKNQFYTKGDEYDDDVRMGCLAYGLAVKDGHVVLDSKGSIGGSCEPALVEAPADTPVDEKEEV